MAFAGRPGILCKHAHAKAVGIRGNAIVADRMLQNFGLGCGISHCLGSIQGKTPGQAEAIHGIVSVEQMLINS